MDLHEDAGQNIVTATFEFPGVKKEDVQLEFHNGRLTVSAENRISEEHNENGYAVRERRYGKWSRTLQLPTGVKVSNSRGAVHGAEEQGTHACSAGERDQGVDGERRADGDLPAHVGGGCAQEDRGELNNISCTPYHNTSNNVQ